MLLVTGGAGFVGSHLSRALAARGERVVISDRLRHSGKQENIADILLDDIVPPDQVLSWLDGRKGLKAVVHLGAKDGSQEPDKDILLRANFGMTKSIWTWCAENRVPLIYASSSATYGQGNQGFDDEATPEALAKLKPNSGYAWTKHLFDRWAVNEVFSGRPRPPRWMGLKFFNAYGPGDAHKEKAPTFITHLLRQLKESDSVTLYASERPDIADGDQRRDFIYVGDIVEVVLWLIDSCKTSGLVNVGSGHAPSLNEVAEAVFDLVGKPVNIEYVRAPERVRAHMQYYTCAKLDRLRAAGYERPFVKIREGIGKYVEVPAKG